MACSKMSLEGDGFYLPRRAARSCISVVYGLFREFCGSILKSRSLFGPLPHRQEIPDDLTTLLALEHPDVTLFAPRLLMESFEQIGRADQRDQ